MILAPDARDLFETDAHNHPTCPIRDGLKVVSFQYPSIEQNILAEGSRYYSSRAGGPFLLMRSGAVLLALDSDSLDDEQKSLTDRQKTNLSYWIYKHNLENRLFDELPDREVLQEPGQFARWMNDHRNRVLKLDQAWVVGHRDWPPLAEDRMLTFLREIIRSTDAGEPYPNGDLLRAAGGCLQEGALKELLLYAIDKGWVEAGEAPGEPFFPRLTNITLGLGARLYVEEKLGNIGQERQGFVAMWFDDSMDPVYDDGIAPAIRAAGYEPYKIDEDDFTGGVVDRILAEIRKSKFVVADLTTSPESGVRGGVYFEAGFALGLDKTVFLTCREDRTEAVHFDINHLNRIEWETPENLREQLQNSILAVLDRGPLDPPDDQPIDSQQPESTAA